MDPKQLSHVRRAISRARNTGGRIRYSRFIKQSVVGWLRAGISAGEIARATGIGMPTLMRWSELSVDDGFRRVGVSSSVSPTRRITAALPSGVRLSSPSIDLLIEALELFR